MTTQNMNVEQVQSRMSELKEQIAFWVEEKKAIDARRYDVTYKGDRFKNMDIIQAKIVDLQEEFEELLDREFALLLL